MLYKQRVAIFVVIFILFLCTGFILLDIDKIIDNKPDVEKFTTSVSGIVNVKKYLRSGNAYREILENNIFSSQQAPAIVVVRNEVAVKSDIELVLNGIIVSPDSSIVLVTDTQEKTSHFLVEGESLKGWSLNKIESKSVTFINKAGKQLILMINEDNMD